MSLYKVCVSARGVLCAAVLMMMLPLHGQRVDALAVSDSLFARGVSLSGVGEWGAAAEVFVSVDSLDRLLWPEGDIRRDYAPWWAAYCLCQAGDTARARAFHADNYALAPPDRRLLRYADSLFMAAAAHIEAGVYDAAYQTGAAAAEESLKALGDNHFACITYLETAGVYAYYVDALAEAATYMEAAFAIAQATTDETHPAYATLLSDLNAVYQAQGRIADALRVNEQCLAVVERTIGSAHPNYADFLGNAATLYDIVGNYRAAARMGEKALAVCAEDDEGRIVLLNNQTLYYSTLGQCREALRTGKEAVRLSAEMKGLNHLDYALAIYNLALVEEKVGLYAEARAHYEQALNIRRQIGSPKGYAQTLMSLAAFEANAGNFSQAIAQAEEALGFLAQSIGERTQEYAHTLNSLALIYSRHGDYAEARRINAQSLNLCADMLGEQHPNYALTLNNLATICYYEGDYTEALNLALQAREIILAAEGGESPHYALALSNIAAILFALEDYERSLSYQQEAANNALHTTGDLSPRYVGMLVNIAQCHARLAQVDSALIIGEQVRSLRERLYGQEHPLYVESLSSLASFHHFAGHNDEAIAIQRDVLARTEQLLGNEHPDYCEALQRLCVYESMNGQAPAAEQVAEASEQSLRFISHSFADMGGHKREMFWQKYRAWFEHWVHHFAGQEPTDERVAEAFDAALTSKGLLLNAETAFSALVKESGNAQMDSLYQQWMQMDAEFDRQLALTRSERTVDLDSLQAASKALEGQLLSMAKEFGNFLSYMSIRLTDVAAKLATDEAAIEFVAYPDEQGGVQYVAYTLRADATVRRTAICTESQLLAIDKADLYTTYALTHLIWEPLADVLTGIQRVYFSPSGELHNLAIEWLPTGDGRLVCEKLELRRLSSTRELVLSQELPPFASLAESKAAVFGGLTYGSDLPALPGSRAEAIAVAEALTDAGSEVQLFTDSLGTAEALTSLSGQHLQLLHLSTHGYYYPHAPRDKQRVDDLFYPHSYEDALRYSGLIAAGGEEVSALALSSLNMRGLDLVALSACRTGLGEVTGDGVFGLQRAFKKAGARSLMMTLWDVSDQVTALFMPRFYANLAAGNNPYNALREAQDFLRKQTPYTAPVYWAPFILLDAITPTHN